MDPLDLTQSFIERCERADPASELTNAFKDVLANMGFRYFACCSHVNPSNPPRDAIVLHNYPHAWASSYAARNLHLHDPVRQRAERDILPFFWDTPEFAASLTVPQKQIMREAASCGIAHGYTVPIHVPWKPGAHRASCSVIPDSVAIRTHAYRAVQIMAMYLYASVAPHNSSDASRAPEPGVGPILSPRERQCLELAASGKSDWAISQLLHISEHTVHKHVEAAKRRLGVATRVQAIVLATQRREISPL